MQQLQDILRHSVEGSDRPQEQVNAIARRN